MSKSNVSLSSFDAPSSDESPAESQLTTNKLVINRRTLMQSAACAALASLVRHKPTTSAQSAEPSRGLPNIILCMSDDQGWGDVGYNGHPVLQTPNLDEMANNSLQFDRFYSAAPVCSPTRGSVLTGRHPNRYKCFHATFPLPATEISVAHLLKQAGYATGHFGKWHLGSVEADSTTNPSAHGFDKWFSNVVNTQYNSTYSRNGVFVTVGGESSMVIVNEAIRFIVEHANADQPVFAIVWFNAPHDPHVASSADKSLYARQSGPLQRYYGEITAMDRAIGVLRESLREMGVQDNTMLWFCSDNGGSQEVSSNGGRGAKGSIFEGGIRVPGLLEWPARIPTSRRTNIPCVTSDILPTLCEIANAEQPSDRVLDGLSLYPLIVNTWKNRPAPIGFWKYGNKPYRPPESAAFAAEIFPDTNESAWLDWPWKLYCSGEPDNENSNVFLYNLESDPFESISRVDTNPEITHKMRSALNLWMQSVRQSMNDSSSAQRIQT